MAKKKEAQEQPAEGVLTAAAKKVGKAAGKVASAVGATAETPAEAPPPAPKPQTKSVKVPKLEKKNKSRLPRKVKKAQQKAASR